MSATVECPYCENEMPIDTTDIDYDHENEHECDHCNKSFIFFAHVSVNTTSLKVDQ